MNHPYPTPTTDTQPPCLKNPDLWQPPPENNSRYTRNHPDVIKACKGCTTCPRQRQCATEALQHPHNTGVWAGQFLTANRSRNKHVRKQLELIATQKI